MTFKGKVYVLQIAIAFVFLWFGVEKLIAPDTWVYWVPELLTTYTKINPAQFMLVNGGIEVFLGIWLLLPWKTHWAAWLTALYFIPILLMTGFSGVGIRDIGLFLSTVALALLAMPANIDLHFKN